MRSKLLPAALILTLLAAGCGGSGQPVASSATPAQPSSPAAAGSTLKPRPGDLETYLVLIDMAAYKLKVAAAFDKYITFGDASAVRALLPANASEMPQLSDRKKRLEAALAVSPGVVEAKCLVRLQGLDPYQLGGSGALVSYLYSASDWLRETLTAKDISDLTLGYPIGEHTEIIRPTDAAEIRANIRNIPVPDDAAIKAQLAALLTTMEAASKNPNFALALVMK